MTGLVGIVAAGCAPAEAPTVPDVPETTTTRPAVTEPTSTEPETTVAETTTTTRPAVSEPTSTEPEAPDPGDEDPESYPDAAEFDFFFETGTDGWVVGFADLPTDYDQSIYELEGGHRAMPDGLDGAGIYLQGHNRSDDLFMYLTRKVEGLTPAGSYKVSITVDLATNAPLDSIGIGGSPGQSVYVKAGASTAEPEATPDRIDHLRLNIDKGNQARGGSQMVVIGVVGHPDIEGDEFRLKTLDNRDSPVIVEADEAGGAWLIVGTDSGFEGLTRLYYDRISASLTAVESA